jgi:phenylacetate-CoA ligase
MLVRIEGEGADAAAIGASVQALLKLRGRVEIVPPRSLPNDGKVIDDQRSYD